VRGGANLIKDTSWVGWWGAERWGAEQWGGTSSRHAGAGYRGYTPPAPR